MLVSHRFSTVRMADLILVVRERPRSSNGARMPTWSRGGLYAELYGLQASAYR